MYFYKLLIFVLLHSCSCILLYSDGRSFQPQGEDLGETGGALQHNFGAVE
jgi:hypothetical protein